MPNNWIAGSIKKPGSFSAAAKRKGMTTKEFANTVQSNPEDYTTTTERRANLAETLMRLRKK